jgi:hypothetical protein
VLVQEVVVVLFDLLARMPPLQGSAVDVGQHR